MIQEIIVGLIAFFALAYLGRKIFRSLKADSKPGCEKCAAHTSTHAPKSPSRV